MTQPIEMIKTKVEPNDAGTNQLLLPSLWCVCSRQQTLSVIAERRGTEQGNAGFTFSGLLTIIQMKQSKKQSRRIPELQLQAAMRGNKQTWLPLKSPQKATKGEERLH